MKRVEPENDLVVEKNIVGQIQDHLNIAGPVISAFVMQKIVMITSVIAVGHLGAHYLAASGLASVTANVTGNSMVLGMAGALVTLCSQANGSNNKQEMCLALQRALIILWLFICLPASILWLCSEPIMVALGQNEAIARSTKDYMILMIPGLWFLTATQCITTFLYAQAKTGAVAYITLTVALLHPLWLYLFIYVMGIGFLGAAIALSLTKLLELIILLLYVNVFTSIMKDAGFEWSRESLTQWGPFLKIGLPNLLMMSEWWASEVIIFMSGALPDPEVQMGAMSIYQNMLALCFMLPAGVREACSTIVGNAIGAGKAHIARASSIIAPVLALVGCTIMSACVLPLRYKIGHIFSDDARVVHLLGTLAPVFAAYIISDGQQTALTGVIKGIGKQYIAGPIVFLSYYAVGIPLSTVLALDLGGKGCNMGVKGLCIGTLVGTIVHMLCFAVVVYGFTDMQVEVNQLQERSKSQHATAGAGVVNPLQTPAEFNITGDGGATSGRGRAGSVHKISSVGEDSDEAWWDDLSFLGIETTRPGTTAINRNNGVIRVLGNMFTEAQGRLYSTIYGDGGAAVNRASRMSGSQQYASVRDSSSHGGRYRSRQRSGSTGYEMVSPLSSHSGSNGSLHVVEEDDGYMDIDFDFI